MISPISMPKCFVNNLYNQNDLFYTDLNAPKIHKNKTIRQSHFVFLENS